MSGKKKGQVGPSSQESWQFDTQLRAMHTFYVLHPFTISHTVHLPRNEQLGECGAYVVRALQLMTEGLSRFDSINDAFIGADHQFLAVAIHRNIP